MNSSSGPNQTTTRINKPNQNIQVYVRVRPLNARERGIKSSEVIEVHPPREILARHIADTKLTKKFTFDRTFGPDSKQHEVYETVVAPLIEEVLAGYNCTVFAYGQTGTGKTHTMVGTECAELKSSWGDDTEVGIIPRALSHLFDELRMMELEFSMRISYLELYNEELCDLLSSEDSTKIRIFDDSNKKGSVIIQGLEEIPVHSKDDVYKLLEKGKERRKTATTLMNAQSSRSHTVFSILVHIKENGIDGEEMLKIGKLNLVDLAGSENVSKAGNEKGIRTRETVNINQSLLTLGRVITALVERTPHIPYRESKLTRLLQESLGGRTKTSIIATISPGHKDLEETLSTLEYAHRAKNIQNRPEVNQKLTKKTVLKEYTEEIDKLKRDLMAARDKNGIYLAEETYNDIQYKLDSQNRELNEKMLLLKALKDDMASKERLFNEVSLNLVEKTEELIKKEKDLTKTQGELQITKKVLTTTKRRYKEKKILLESHVKTEEILLNQASKLIEVADIATNDTVQLLNTIDRRRDVDVRIQSVCEQFANRMKDSFELMDENLVNLKKDHTSHTDIIMEEIDNSTKLQNNFATEAMAKVDTLNNSIMTSLVSLTDCVSKYLLSLSSSSQEHNTAMLQMFVELKSKESELKTNLQQQLGEMTLLFDEQNSSVEKANQQINARITESQLSVSTHTESLKQRLQGIAQKSKTSLEDQIGQLIANMNARKELATLRQNALSEFLKQMQQLEVKEGDLTAATTTITDNLELNKTQTQSSLAAELTTADEFCGVRQKALVGLQNECNSFSTEIKCNSEKCRAVIAGLEGQQNETHNVIVERLEQAQQLADSNCTQIKKSLGAHQKEVKEIQEKSAAGLSSECQVVQVLIKTENTRLNEHDTQNTALTTSLQNNVKDYASIYTDQMRHCVEDLNAFRTNEMKTYAPTGQTPSKREFSYPRVLASTSPHNQIVKRLRQENDWSDLEMTINEDSEIAVDISESDGMLNSTPIELNSSDKNKETNNKTRDGTCMVSLKPQLNSRKPLSRKNSPVITAYNKENKENM